MTTVTLRQDTRLIRIADLCLFVERGDWTCAALMADPRSFEIDTESSDLTWSPMDMAPRPDWRAGKKGLPFTAWATLHCQKNGLTFAMLDIGANIGMEGIAQAILHRRCGWDAPVFLFEPGPTFDLVERSLRRNCVTDIARAVRAAVSDTSGEQVFHCLVDATGGSSLLEQKMSCLAGPQTIETINVEVVAIDDFIKRNEISCEALVAKIDTEGNDFKVIAGMAETIRDKFVFMQIEFIPNLIETYCSPQQVLAQLLETHVLVDSATRSLVTGDRIASFTETSRSLRHPPDVYALPRHVPDAISLLEAVLAG